MACRGRPAGVAHWMISKPSIRAFRAAERLTLALGPGGTAGTCALSPASLRATANEREGYLYGWP